MKVVIDDKIPYIEGALEPFGEVVYLSGPKTTPEVVRNADAIITRTRTICNEHLLSNSTVKIIATATIGYDHIDTDYCDKAGIKWTNSPGCNSKSVEQYIASALFVLSERKGFKLEDMTIGIVGVGQVGSKVARVCEMFGMRVLLNDPPRQRNENSDIFCSLKTIMDEADIISLHVPLNMEGQDSTFHLADYDFFQSLKKKPYVFNSCRGEVLNTGSAKEALKNGLISGLVIDCWENEPDLDLELLEMVELGTPHVAGYSKDGKANGTSMTIRALSRFFNLGIDNWSASNVEEPENPVIVIDGKGKDTQQVLSEAVLSTYDIRRDDEDLRKNPGLFEKLRGDYYVRREYPAFTVRVSNIDAKTIKIIEDLGFKTEK